MNISISPSFRRLLRGYALPQAKGLAALAVLLLGLTAADLIAPLLIRQFIDQARIRSPVAALTMTALLYVGTVGATQAVSVAETWLTTSLAARATNRLRLDMFRHCLDLDPAFHQDNPPGTLVSRIDGDAGLLGMLFSRLVLNFATSGLLLAGSILVMIGINHVLGPAMLAFAACVLVGLRRLAGIATPTWTHALQVEGEMFGTAEEILGATEDLRSNAAEDFAIGRFLRQGADHMRTEVRAMVLGQSGAYFAVLTFAVATGLGIVLTADLYRSGVISLGTIYLVFTYAETIRSPIDTLVRQLRGMQSAGAAVARVSGVLSELPSLAVPDVPAVFPSGTPSVSFEDVSFGYGDEEVLRSLSFQLPAGARLGILGRTGSGKTTLGRLLLRLHDPISGRLLLNGTDIRDFEPRVVRRHVASVGQEAYLFHGTLRDNLTMLDPNQSDHDVVEALRAVGMDEWLDGLPDGLDTDLLAGRTLSAGEQQLLAIGRALLGNARVVLLDEASARIDPATERTLRAAFERLTTGRTSLVIAHRLSTVESCDYLLVVESGPVAEFGKLGELAADPSSHYARLRRGLDLVELA